MTRLFREHCGSCEGVGTHVDDVGWHLCEFCDGIGWVWESGGPSFGARNGNLSDRIPGEVVRIGPDGGTLAVVAWHEPRKTRKVIPVTTYLRIIDEWAETQSDPSPMPSTLGVWSVVETKTAGEETSREVDIVDPFVKLQAHRGDLL